MVAVAAPEISFGDDFLKVLNNLEAAEVKRVLGAVDQFRRDPDHPSLNFHPVHGDPTGRLHTFRATRDIRVLGARQGSVYVLQEAGHHDAIYERAERLRFVSAPAIGFVGLVSTDGAIPRSDRHIAAPVANDEWPGVLDHWTDEELGRAGFGAHELPGLRACKRLDDLLDLDVEYAQLNQLLEMVEQTPEQWFKPSLDPAAEAEARFRRAIQSYGALSGISQLFSPEEVERLAAAPIEEWMIFLHPDQRAVVEQRYSGPARVRGSAGTGKTVVALHRAAELAQRFAEEEDDPAPILFTTFIKTLPPVFEQLYRRLPRAKPDSVRFVNLDKLALEICRESGDRLSIDPRLVDAAFATAWKEVVRDGTPLANAALTRQYLRDEINAVIKGRGVRSIDEYLAMERTGRGTRFTEPLRRQTWELKQEWDAQMARRGTQDFVDIVRRARDHARRRAAPSFRAAIIDEAQDLSLVGLQLVRALVNGPSAVDQKDGLLIVGDGAQRIYAGGFTLRQAGVEVRGRTTVLRTNYRNTREIISAAMAVAGDHAVDDLGEEYKRGDAEAEAQRAGLRPILVECSDYDDELSFIAERAKHLVSIGAVGYGDLAVCVPTNAHASIARMVLGRADIPVIDLKDYGGTTVDAVKVGTHFRAKGLEFKVVFLPGLGADEFPRKQASGQGDEEHAEQVALAMSQLFVAMTRARDGLFLLTSVNPSPSLVDALDAFEVIESKTTSHA